MRLKWLLGPPGLTEHLSQLRGRTMRCRKAEVVPIECVVRGYLAGSGWKDYQRTSAVCGIKLPTGLTQCQQLADPIFTPATKAEEGHDENISFAPWPGFSSHADAWTTTAATTAYPIATRTTRRSFSSRQNSLNLTAFLPSTDSPRR